MPKRHFPPRWSVVEDNFIVLNRNGQALAYVYYEEEPSRPSAAQLLTRDEARRIAVNLARLPDLLRGRRTWATQVRCFVSSTCHKLDVLFY